jgi:AcrR family transcriptional regulator
MALRVLSRGEGKSVTRQRLLDAAAWVLGETGYGGLSASAVARRAGVAQATFYVHFRDKDDLLRTLGEMEIGALRARLRRARERVLEGHGVDAVRETFRVSLQTWIEHPGLFRMYAQELRHPGSPVGVMARQLREEVCRELAEDLGRLGLPAATPADREQVDMVAEAIVAQTEALALGYLDGKYASLDGIIEVLTRFTVGVIGLDPRLS